MFFAKVNVNSNVYEICDKPEKLQEIIDNIIVKVNQDKTVVLGKDYKKDAGMVIKFIELQKDVSKQYISGQLIKIYREEILQYNENEDKITKLPPIPLARTATFFFDARTERVGFTLGQYFGKDKFCEYFRKMLEAFSEVELNVGLILDEATLLEKMKRFKRIDSIAVDMVLPNPPAREELNKLFAGNAENLEEMNAHSYKQVFLSQKKGKGLNIDTKLVCTLTEGVSNGYGKMQITGTADSTENMVVNSSKDCPYKQPIRSNEKNSVPVVMELGKKYIGWLMSKIKR
ncbi:MAG: hypothetical protein H6Q70_499 [Firmicutes bacterium]|nr:hypothetical protein [Bacillota bacterium]